MTGVDHSSQHSANPMCRRFRVTGRVQGVFFRASTQTTARDLGVTGHAVNLPDGSVEVLACGGRAELDELARWLREGPPMAQVANVAAESLEYREFDDFRTG
ncbi:MAG: acylphosphatase [Woeseia sp.]